MFGDEIHCHAACHLTGLMTAHAVGKHRKAEVQSGDDAVFVLAAHAPGMRQTAHDELHAVFHAGALAGIGRRRRIFAGRLRADITALGRIGW